MPDIMTSLVIIASILVRLSRIPGFHLEMLARGEVGGGTLIKIMGVVTEFLLDTIFCMTSLIYMKFLGGKLPPCLHNNGTATAVLAVPVPPPLLLDCTHCI